MLLGGAREVGTAGELGAAGPDQVAAGLDLGREKLVLEVASGEVDPLRQLADLRRLGHVASQRLFAGDALELAPPSLDGVDDLLEVLDPCLVGAADPQRVDGRVRDHLGDGAIRLGPAHVHLPRQSRGGRGILVVRTPDAENVGIPHAGPGPDVELGIEPAADESDPQTLACHIRHSSSVTSHESQVASIDPGRSTLVTRDL